MALERLTVRKINGDPEEDVEHISVAETFPADQQEPKLAPMTLCGKSTLGMFCPAWNDPMWPLGCMDCVRRSKGVIPIGGTR